jgi:hypothetical protein
MNSLVLTITADGTIHVSNDSDPLIPLPGSSPRDTALHHLRLEAAGTGQTLHCTLHDQTTGLTEQHVIEPASSVPPVPADAPLPTSPTPSPPRTPPDFSERMILIRDLAFGGAHQQAIERADALMADLIVLQGPDGPESLILAYDRGTLAFLTHDYAYALRSWSWIAAAWFDAQGGMCHYPATDHEPCRRIVRAASDAVNAWISLPGEQARAECAELLKLLRYLSPDPEAPLIQFVESQQAAIERDREPKPS